MAKWLDKLKQKIEQAQEADDVDVAHHRFNDAFSHQVEWTPLKPGGSNFGTHYLVKPESGGRLMMFKPTKGGLAFGFVFLLIGMAILVYMAWHMVNGQGLELFWVGLLIGLPFSVAGIFLIRWLYKPRVFDLVSRDFYSGFKKPDSHRQDKLADLNRVKALQLITEKVKANKNRYNSYELNLILDDGRRVAVVDHGNFEQILLDAEQLAKALQVPLWDNT
ncbi:MAG: hypothetical protein DWP95_09270 [Proteobacteria bacterium]|nr:MAG: hypothetical protein DWP95_09270 [Pseudomonadota bacterium]